MQHIWNQPTDEFLQQQKDSLSEAGIDPSILVEGTEDPAEARAAAEVEVDRIMGTMSQAPHSRRAHCVIESSRRCGE